MSFVLGRDASVYVGVARLLQWVRNWRATEVYPEEEPVGCNTTSLQIGRIHSTTEFVHPRRVPKFGSRSRKISDLQAGGRYFWHPTPSDRPHSWRFFAPFSGFWYSCARETS